MTLLGVGRTCTMKDMKFHELCKTKKFKSTPSVYFGPQELDKEKGEYPFLIQFIDEEYPERSKKEKTYWSTVIELLEDCRTDQTTNPISPGRYRFDLTEEYMATLFTLSQKVDLFSIPIVFNHSRRYKGKHLFSFYEFQVSVDKAKSAPNVSDKKTASVIEPPSKVKPVNSDDDWDFGFDKE